MKQRYRSIVIRMPLLLLAGVCWTAAAQTIEPTFLQFPDADSPNSRAYGVNAYGQVAGSYHAGGANHLFIWQDGKIIASPATDYTPVAINDLGQVVLNGDVQRPQIWQNGHFTTLTSPVALNYATGINNLGQVPGCDMVWISFPVLYLQSSVLWEQHSFTPLRAGRPGVPDCAYAMNNLGQIVGGASLFGNYAKAFVWDHGTTTTLDFNGQGVAYAINDAGQIAGYTFDGTGGYVAFLYQNGARTTLMPPGETVSTAVAIDSQGRVLLTSGSNGRGAWVWKAGTFYQLNQGRVGPNGIAAVGEGAMVAGVCDVTRPTASHTVMRVSGTSRRTLPLKMPSPP